MAVERYEHLDKLVSAIEEGWPAHLAFIDRHLAARTEEELEFLNEVSRRVILMAGGNLEVYARSYRQVCLQYMQAEMEFRRQHRYAHCRFGEVVAALYSDSTAMLDYMTGLLVSLVFWWQNGAPLMYFKDAFLPRFESRFSLLEIGPGHGMATSFALESPRCARVVGVDVSHVSLDLARECLAVLGIRKGFEPVRMDICESGPSDGTFDGAVVSQVLEIVSDPAAALANLRGSLKENALLYINAPVDLAAPDHIRRWKVADEIDHLLQETGFRIVDSECFFPATKGESSESGFAYALLARRE